MQKTLLAALSLALIFAAISCTDLSKPSKPAPSESVKISAPDPVPDAREWVCKAIDSRPDSRAVGAKGRFWTTGQTLKIGFIGGTAKQRQFAIDGFAEWGKYANLKFTFPASGKYDCRIAFDPGAGAWSYIGTDSKGVASTSPTMNLGWDGNDVSYHEIGHFLGLCHEHQTPVEPIQWNEANVLTDLQGPPNYWTPAMIHSNVLDALPTSNVIATSRDDASIMMYQIPARWKKDGVAIPGGKVLSAVDKSFIAQRYPGVTNPPPPATETITLKKTDATAILNSLIATRTAADSSVARWKRLTGL